MSAPRLLAWDLRTPAGGAAATLAALRDGLGAPGDLPGELLPLLVELATPLLDGVDLILLATTKGDCPLYCEDLLGADRGLGSPAWLAGELGRIFARPAYALSAACASGSAALAEAGRLIRCGTRRRVLVLGGDRLAPFISDGFAVLRASTATCRPFDAERSGLVLGETAAALLVGTGDNGPLLSGWGQACDAVHLTAPCREGSGLGRAISAACGATRPAWICGHGTGTRYNDASEAAAYRRLLPGVPVLGWKGLLGHSLGACGLSEAVLIAELLQRGRTVPGTAGLAQADPTLGIAVLGPGGQVLPPGPVLSTNAGFGGLDAAVLLGGDAAATTSRPLPRRIATVAIDHAGWRRTGQRPDKGRWLTPAEPGRLPRPGAREILGQVDAGWGRMDTASRCLVAACRLLAPIPAEAALLLVTERGCAAVDRAYEYRRRHGTVDAQAFVYTLPSTPLGEASIRCGVHGPAQVLLGAADRAVADSVAALLADGVPAVVVAWLESDGPAQQCRVDCWQA